MPAWSLAYRHVATWHPNFRVVGGIPRLTAISRDQDTHGFLEHCTRSRQRARDGPARQDVVSLKNSPRRRPRLAAVASGTTEARRSRCALGVSARAASTDPVIETVASGTRTGSSWVSTPFIGNFADICSCGDHADTHDPRARTCDATSLERARGETQKFATTHSAEVNARPTRSASPRWQPPNDPARPRPPQRGFHDHDPICSAIDAGRSAVWSMHARACTDISDGYRRVGPGRTRARARSARRLVETAAGTAPWFSTHHGSAWTAAPGCAAAGRDVESPPCCQSPTPRAP